VFFIKIVIKKYHFYSIIMGVNTFFLYFSFTYPEKDAKTIEQNKII